MNSALPRSIIKLPYAAARRPFTLLEDLVVARCWDQDAPARVGFERWLGSLDLFAGRLLADDEITRRGQALMRPSGRLAHDSSHDEDAPLQPAHARQAPPYPHPQTLADDQAPEMRDQIAADQEQDDPQQAQHAADRQATTGSATTGPAAPWSSPGSDPPASITRS